VGSLKVSGRIRKGKWTVKGVEKTARRSVKKRGNHFDRGKDCQSLTKKKTRGGGGKKNRDVL